MQLLCALGLCIAMVSCAKTETTAKPPTAALGQSTTAQSELRSLEQSWREGRERERQQLEPRLRAFIAAHRKEPETRQVMLWLGWLCIDAQKYDEALALADEASADQEGTISDAARTLRAAVHTRRGQPDQALRLLEPLSGMIVDALDRDSWSREIIRATLKLRHYDDALKWALVWRLECSEDRRAAVEREITSIIERVSRAALERLWAQLEIAVQLPTTVPGRKQARAWMRSAVTQRLARYAIYNQDASLAQRLLYDPTVSLQRNVSLKRLARIAARAETENQNVGRKIGIVLDLDDPQQRRRSSEMVTGILQTLDEASEKDRAQLLTREASRSDPNGYDDAINDLYNEGVAVVIGGFDAPSAAELTTRARPRGIAVVALAPLAHTERSEQAFFIDTSDAQAVVAWREHVKSGANNGLEITDQDPFCTGAAVPPFDTWQSTHIELVYFAVGSACAERYGYAAAQNQHLPAIWLGPKALASVDAWQAPIAGFVTFEPILSKAQSDSTLAVWQQRFSRLPNYYEALGHDTTVLVVAALNRVPNLIVSNASVRDQVLSRVGRELLQARAALWTSSNRGFAADHGLVPTYIVGTGRPPAVSGPLGQESHAPAQ
jgi:hypothetical protein